MKYESKKNQKYKKVENFIPELFDVDVDDTELWSFAWGEQGHNCQSFLLCNENKDIFKFVPQSPKMHNLLIDNFNCVEYLLLRYRTGMDTVVYTRLTNMRDEIEDLLDKCKIGNYCSPCNDIEIISASKV